MDTHPWARPTWPIEDAPREDAIFCDERPRLPLNVVAEYRQGAPPPDGLGIGPLGVIPCVFATVAIYCPSNQENQLLLPRRYTRNSEAAGL